MQSIDETVSTAEAVVPVIESALDKADEGIAAVPGLPADDLRKEIAEVRALFETLSNQFNTVKSVIEELKSFIKTTEALKKDVPSVESVEKLVANVVPVGYCGCLSRKK